MVFYMRTRDHFPSPLEVVRERVHMHGGHRHFEREQQLLEDLALSVTLLAAHVPPVLNDKRQHRAENNGGNGEPAFGLDPPHHSRLFNHSNTMRVYPKGGLVRND